MKGLGVFWGSFDPPTLAHQAIIKEMLARFQQTIIVVNNNSQVNYYATAADRVNMLDNMLVAHQNKYTILIQNDDHQHDYCNLRQHTRANLYVVAGTDAIQNWLATHTLPDLAKYDGLYVVPRNDDADHLIAIANNIVKLPLAAAYNQVSSSLARENLAAIVPDNILLTKLLDSTVIEYIKQHNLYQKQAGL